MALSDQTPYLSFSNIESDRPVVAFCSQCGKRFETAPEVAKHVDQLILDVRADFDAHQCKGSPGST